MELPETQRYCDLDEATVPRAEVIVGAATDSRELVNTDVRAPVADVPSAYLDDDPRAAMTSTRVAVHWNAQTNAVELSVLELGQSPAPGTVAAILVPVSETCALDLARVLSGQTA